jgi:hypothetical protein
MSRWSRSESLHRQMVRLVQQGRVRVLDSPGVTYSRRRGGLNRPNALAAPAFVHAKGFAPNGCLRAMELGPAESRSQRASKRFITASADRRGCLSLVGCPDDLVSSIFSDCIIVPIRGQFHANIFKSRRHVGESRLIEVQDGGRRAAPSLSISGTAKALTRRSNPKRVRPA